MNAFVRTVIFLSAVLILTLFAGAVEAVSLNADGKGVVRLAADEYSRIVPDNPVVSDSSRVEKQISKMERKAR